MKPGRDRLRRLVVNEIEALLRSLPGLNTMWARPANVSATALADRQSSALRAVQVGISRDPELFAHAIALSAVSKLLSNKHGKVGPDEVADDATVQELAVYLGEIFGDGLGSFVLDVVAESQLPLAVHARDRLEELRALATGHSQLPGSEFPRRSDVGFDIVDSDVEEFDEAGSRKPSGQTLLDEIANLLAEARTVSTALANLAVAIGADDPLGDASVRFLDGARDWVARHRALASPDETLSELAERTRAGMQARSDELADLVELADTVGGLKDRYQRILLVEHGFSLPEELAARIALLRGGGSTDDARGPRVDGPRRGESEPVLNDPEARPDESLLDSGSDKPGLKKREPEPVVEEPESETEPEAELHADTVPVSDTAPDAARESGTHLDPHPNSEPGTGPDPRLEPESGTDTATEEELDVDTKIVIGPEEYTDASHAVTINDAAPWVDGQVADLIATHRELLAALAVGALNVTESRAQMVRLVAGAFSTRSENLLIQEPELFLYDSADAERNTDENRVLFAAYSRLALELGFSPVGSLERFRQAASLDDHPAAALAGEIVQLTTRGFKRPTGGIELSALPDDWAAFADDAERTITSLENTSVTYQRASRIIHYLVRANQPLGRALRTCLDLGRGYAEGRTFERPAWLDVEETLALLRTSQQSERLLNEADRVVSSAQQVRKPIIASARDRLTSSLDEISNVLEAGLALRTRAEGSDATADPQGMADLVGIAQSIGEVPIRSVGDAVLQRLIEWILASDVSVASVPLVDLLQQQLLPLFEIPRDRDGAPERSVPTDTELRSLERGRDRLTVISGYLDMGNILAAKQYLTQTRDRTEPIDEELFATAIQRHRRRLRELTSQVERTLDRLRSLNDGDLVRLLTEELEEHRDETPGRFDLQAPILQSIGDRAERALEEVRSGLRHRAAALPLQPESRRVLALLESQDEQLAVDYIALAEAGEPLPTLDAPEGDDFGEFFPAVVRNAESSNRDRAIDNMAAVRRALAAAATPANRLLARGLTSWNELGAEVGASNATPARLANVLRMLGLTPETDRWCKELTRERHAGFASFEVRASPVDRSYVPTLGSQAHGSYDITIVWDAVSPKTLLNHIDRNRRTRANVILYLRSMTVDQRMELRKLTARAGFEFSPLVVDMPVVAWVTSKEEPSWRSTQRVTLPFTTLNPYAPFAGGEVPDEVFVGREAERRDIVEPTGSMFVYGGRQLGKSALLRRVERGLMSDWARDQGHAAIYLDLKSEGIGESAAPSALWGALAPRLARVGIETTVGKSPSAGSITDSIHEWLDGDTSRRLLLLLDEADNFLTLDAQGEAGQIGSFPVLQRLKGLMERTGRRFKPVFAGLHQVQRFHELPNTPVVHGGQDVLIGPLTSVDARELVRDPLLALGYEFETEDTMWRLLRLTNYQASLIQIICDAVVRHMRNRDLPATGGRVTIRTGDVDDVYSKRDVRDLIVQRFRWTINLDSRYKVIALVTALRSLESMPGERFRASELHDDCESFWPAGFSRSTLSSREFFRYLDEMQGLGVLHRQGEDEFGLRSPSILGLIGSRDTIEAELLEAADQLEVGYQYNPAVNRRILSADPSGAEIRSPLPDSDLAELLSHDSNGPRVRIVAGTAALGLDLVTTAIEKAASDRLDRSVRIVVADPATLADQLAGEHDAHLLLDLSAESKATRKQALALLARSGAFATVVIPASEVPLDDASFDWPIVRLRRWSVEGLKSLYSWQFNRGDLRSETGGWPQLVSEVLRLVDAGSKTEDALDSVVAGLRDPGRAAAFLTSTGVPLEDVKGWVEWFGSDSESGEVEMSPASRDDLDAALERDSRPILNLLQQLDAVDEARGGWLLDRAIATASRHARA